MNKNVWIGNHLCLLAAERFDSLEDWLLPQCNRHVGLSQSRMWHEAKFSKWLFCLHVLFFPFSCCFQQTKSTTVGVYHKNVRVPFVVVFPQLLWCNRCSGAWLAHTALGFSPALSVPSVFLYPGSKSPNSAVLCWASSFHSVCTASEIVQSAKGTAVSPCLTTSLEIFWFIFKSCHLGDKGLSHSRRWNMS